MPTPHAIPAWPFPTRDSNQYRRIDQGWDLQDMSPHAVTVVAAEPGTLSAAGPDPTGFGETYPLLTLDTPVLGNTAIYYGHTFIDITKEGKHVDRGEVIASTGYPHSNGNAYPYANWLEIGWWINGPTGDGASMQSWLTSGQPLGNQGPVPPFGGLNTTIPGEAAIRAATRDIAKVARSLVYTEMRLRPIGRPNWRP